MSERVGPKTSLAELVRIIFLVAVATSTAQGMKSLFAYLRKPSSRHAIYKLIYTVPPSALAATKDAIFAAGGGTYENGRYKRTTFESSGAGVFTPGRHANPAIGKPGEEERVEEVRVEVRCEGYEVTKESVKALLRTHPYETVGYEVFKVEDALMGNSKEETLSSL